MVGFKCRGLAFPSGKTHTKNTKLNLKTETESKNTNHIATKDENRNKEIV